MPNNRFDEFDTGNYNDIAKAYFERAMKNCDVDKKTIEAVLDELKWLLDTVSASEMTK